MIVPLEKVDGALFFCPGCRGQAVSPLCTQSRSIYKPPIFKWRGRRPPAGGDAHHAVEVHVGERLSHHLGDYHLPWSAEGGSQATGSVEELGRALNT